MDLLDLFIKFIFWSCLTVTGVGFADLAMELHNQTVAAYKKGPISARVFTRMLTEEPGRK